MGPGGPGNELTGLRGGGARAKPEERAGPHSRNLRRLRVATGRSPGFFSTHLRVPSTRRTLHADARFLHLPLILTPSGFYS